MTVRVTIDPIKSEETVGWDEPITVESVGVPSEGDFLSIEVDGKVYDCYVKKVLWHLEKDGLHATVRVR